MWGESRASEDYGVVVINFAAGGPCCASCIIRDAQIGPELDPMSATDLRGCSVLVVIICAIS